MWDENVEQHYKTLHFTTSINWLYFIITISTKIIDIMMVICLLEFMNIIYFFTIELKVRPFFASHLNESINF